MLLAGRPLATGGVTVNRLCGSGLQAINSASAELRAGNGAIAIAGGVESMTRAPFVMPKPDSAFPREQLVFDTAIGWRLVNPKMPKEHTLSMGETAEVLAREYEIERTVQDEFALRSHRRAVAAQASGMFNDELVPVAVRRGKTEDVVTMDEGPRPDATIEALAKLPPVFVADGTVTAGNSSPLNDERLWRIARAIVLRSSTWAGIETSSLLHGWQRVVASPLRLIAGRPVIS